MATEPTNIYQALAAAQKQCGPLVKNATNPHFRNQYADLNSVLDLIREPMANNNIAMTQTMSLYDGRTCLNTVLHLTTDPESFITSTAILAAKDADNPQAIGSSISYFRRYQLISLFGLSAEDNDGNHAAASAPTTSHVERAQRPRDERNDYQSSDSADKPTEKQMGLLNAKLKETFGDDTENAKQWMHSLTGKTSRTLLTKQDASKFIDWMIKDAPTQLGGGASDDPDIF